MHQFARWLEKGPFEEYANSEAKLPVRFKETNDPKPRPPRFFCI